jgi:hypothetical protein
MQVGTRIDEAGVLFRESEIFYLRREAGGRFRLDLRRIGIDHVGETVRVRGVYVGDDLVDVTEIAAG